MKTTLPLTYRGAQITVIGRHAPAQSATYDPVLGIGRPALLAEFTVERVEIGGEDVTAQHTARELMEMREMALQEIQR